LAQSSLLESLAERFNQAGAMNWLGYFLKTSSFEGKTPYLVLVMESGTSASPPRLESVRAAVLLFEYRVMGFSSGMFSTDDWAGFRTVIAPEPERDVMSALAADAILGRGAQLVLISFAQRQHRDTAFLPSLRHPAMWVLASRPVSMTLLLEPTIKATLAKLGKSTRFNLGYYRRRLQAVEPSELVSDVQHKFQEHELAALNQASLNPVDPDDFRLQCESARNLPGGFMLGLRTLQGKWLSLIGGWRQGDVTVLYWQSNVAGYEKLSIGTAMRSFFLEHEVERGTRKLVYYGGTPHSMGNSFEREEATDLIVRRRSLRAATLHALVRVFAAMGSHIGIHSLLVQTLASKKLQWRSAGQQVPEAQPHEARL
jgi:hypothetical protein